MSIFAHARRARRAVKLRPMKLLIVENNQDMRRLIVQIVRKLSDAIFECEDGSEALAAYREHQPDWVLMDIEMPLIDGISATRQIIAPSRKPRSPSSPTTTTRVCAPPPRKPGMRIRRQGEPG